MADIKFGKFLGSLPTVLQPDTVYYVLVDGVCTQYVSNSDGTKAFPVESSTELDPFLLMGVN